VRAALAHIGYRVAPEGALDPALSCVLRAFQRHWRPETVNGQADEGTVTRLEAMADLVGSGSAAVAPTQARGHRTSG
jgi:N-acetylmuramoyl-L-alanine amidase